METTPNLGLVLPSETDLPYESVHTFRGDLGTIDEAIGSDRQAISLLQSRAGSLESGASALAGRLDAAEAGLAAEVARAGNGMKVVEVPDWIFDSSGRAEFTFSQLGIPVSGDTVYYPDLGVIAGRLYFAQLVDVTRTGFTVQIYYPDGTPGCDVEESVTAGTFASGEASAGQHALDSVVRLKMRFFIPLGVAASQPATDVNTMNIAG
jgi:hypothetical protein